jgi:prepilin-type N-terminal cleavage/methylation domain-containing protein
MELKRNKIRNTQYAIRDTKYAFTLVEILIVVTILGILAAIILPTLQGHIQQAKESAAKDDLRILRNAIELYAAQHNGVPPGYSSDDPTQNVAWICVYRQLVKPGGYLSEMPKNPFNGNYIVWALRNDETFPAEATGNGGWIYKPATREIRLDWPGTDSKGVRYFDY